METKFRTPPVHFSASGAPYVEPADILLSEAGQEEILKAAKLEIGIPRRSSQEGNTLER
jgi:hypothetical protein